ncbi:MAG: sigma-70 family RNA polymerase sigma factor [Planctomycetes bacterium]|nr:sigma-70 family RNA polymerase sigma factor [Planctomycetota bacterium]
MCNIASPAIADLAHQLERSPIRLRLRHLLNIEFVLSVVESGKRYPYDFVLAGLTGLTRRSSRDYAWESQLIDGDTLRTDLVSLAEELSGDAYISAEHWSEALYSVAQLAKRFEVSTKTIFRWRRRGLVGWKFRFSDRRMRLAFPDRCVRRFVAENDALVNRGSSFSQLTKAERNGIIERARILANGSSRSVNAVARIIATEAGRAVETIRLLLKHYDESHPRNGVFNRSKLHVEADDQRLAVWEAYVDGATVKALAERFNQTVSWAYRTITQMRARELKARKIEFVPSAEFDSPNIDEEIRNDPALKAPTVGEPEKRRRVPRDLPPYLQQLFHIPLLTRAGEAALFRQLNYVKFMADRLCQELDPDTAKATDLDRIEALLAEAGRLKNQITQANLRLVVSIAKRHASADRDFFEIVSDGNISLMRAVDKFDYSRGFKFSTYASWAIMKNYARSIPEQRYRRDRYQTGHDEWLENIPGPPLDEPEDDFLPLLRSALDNMLDTLDEREGSILRQRFGLDDEHRHPQTLEQIGHRFGVSKERIRQLEARAMTKLRGDFQADVQQLLGA